MKLDKLYQGNVRNKMAEWPTYSEDKKKELIGAEENAIFDALATFSTLLLLWSCGPLRTNSYLNVFISISHVDVRRVRGHDTSVRIEDERQFIAERRENDHRGAAAVEHDACHRTRCRMRSASRGRRRRRPARYVVRWYGQRRGTCSTKPNTIYCIQPLVIHI